MYELIVTGCVTIDLFAPYNICDYDSYNQQFTGSCMLASTFSPVISKYIDII